MSTTESKGRPWIGTVAIVSVVALLVAAGVVYLLGRPSGTRYSAMMSTVIGLYPGSDVRILGVRVGTVDALTPEGQLVRVDFRVDDEVKVPAQAMAAVVAPTVVADRYLQLGPVYTGGPTLPAGAVIPKERTATPAEFDDLLASAQKLSVSLGPQGLNRNGALSEALSTAARNLDGNGQRLNTTLDNTAQALTTLSASREDLAGTVRNLQSFTTNLKQDDAQVRAFTKQFAEVNGFLADERENLGATLRELSETLGEVAVFVHDNRAQIKTNVDKLADILGTVTAERLALEQVLDTAPMGLDGLVNSYNASSGTLDTRLNILGSVLCSIYTTLPESPFQVLLGERLGGLIPGGLAGCANAGGASLLRLPQAAANKLNNPKLPMMLGVPGGMSRVRTPGGVTGEARTPGAPPMPAPNNSGATARSVSPEANSDAETDADQPAPRTTTPRRPPSLGELLGGGR